MPKALELVKMLVTIGLALLLLFVVFVFAAGSLIGGGNAWSLLFAAIMLGGLYATVVLLMWNRPFLRRIYYLPVVLMVAGVALVAFMNGQSARERELDRNAIVLAERTGSLYDYEPFVASSSIARLEGPASLRIEGDPPKMDSATALYPVAASFVEAVYPPDGDYSLRSVRSVLTGTGTESAYIRLIYGDVDVILAAGPSADQLSEAAGQGVELNLIPIGREAFVFFVHRDNPVANLTVEQIQGIYSGEITNWRDVGGEDMPIRAFQRSRGSGSQTALEGLMQGKTLMDPPRENIATGMGDILGDVADYKNYPGAIGFSFRYYAQEMVSADEITLLHIEGVEPTRETIRSGLYPISSNFYAVVRAGEVDETLDALLAWMKSAEGQALVEAVGYVPMA